MELQVTLTLSDRLFALLEDKLPNLGRRIEKALTKEIGAQTRRESSIEVAIAPVVETGLQPLESRAPATNGTGADSAPQQECRPMTDSPAIQPEKALTLEDIRAAIHRTRQRFEGENYKENTDSEAYKKHHKALTAQFKQIAIVLGADKPSKLPADKIAAFIAECDALILDENGLVAPPCTILKSK